MAVLIPMANTRRATATGFGPDVRHGLEAEPKILPAQYLYDEVGSALFEAITVLPEYGLTRAEERLISGLADKIAGRLTPVTTVVELGSGSGRKTRPLLEAIAKEYASVAYTAVDLSDAALTTCSQELCGLDGVTVASLQRPYLAGLAEAAQKRPADGRLLVLFLGSSIGNFNGDDAIAFLTRLRKHLRPGDALLLGADLVKHPDRLLEAYDDPAGVTAAFNLNLLARINRELGGNFQLRKFRHEARWSSEDRRIEMHLVSMSHQSVVIPGADCVVPLRHGETIWTESSYKFAAPQLVRMAKATGFTSVEQSIDKEWPFAENLWIAEESHNPDLHLLPVNGE